MLSTFRSMLHSKVGAAIALAALAIIAIAFASGDIAGMRSSGGLAAGGGVATVGDESVSPADLAQGANRALDRFKQQQPTATMKLLVAQGGVEQVLDDLVNRTALFVFGRDHAVAVSDRLIDSEITQIQAFQGVDGKFDQNTFRQALAQRGISEQGLRDDIGRNLTAQQLVIPASTGGVMPEYAARRYASLLGESRSGSVVALPSILFAPEKGPTDKQLDAFYKANTDRFIRPERRVIRYAVMTQDSLKNPPAPTDAEIAARFAANNALYAAQDKRKITQLIAPTEAAAKAIVAEVNGGKTLEAAASAKGLSAASLEFFSMADLTSQSSPEVARAVFAAPVGKLATPGKSPLGWHVIRVDEEQKRPARTLAEVRDEIAAQVAEEKRRKAFTDMLAGIEDQFDSGSSLAEVAKANGLTVRTTEPLTADGQVYGKPGETAPVEIMQLLSSAFAMDQEEPQVAPILTGNMFALYDVTDIAASAPAPLAEIKEDVTAAWKLDAGSRAAKAAALKMQAAIAKGQTLTQAMAAAGKRLPPVEHIAMTRPMLAEALRSGRQVPPPVSLMFQMAKGTVKVQSAPQDRGWFIVQLEKIEPGKVENPEMIKAARRELGGQLGQAYADALAAAVRKDVGVTINSAAVKAVRDQLAGTGATN